MIKIVDCHFHIIDHRRFPFSGRCGYTPRLEESGSFEELQSCWHVAGVTHGLAIQPSGYGHDNSAMIDALGRSEGRLRGIAVVSADACEKTLRDLADVGVTGIRLNLTDFESTDVFGSDTRRLLTTVSAMGWFVDIQCRATEFARLAPVVSATKIRVILDHLGRPDPSKGVDEPGFFEMLKLADGGRAVFKLSGAFRESGKSYPYPDMDPYVAAILKAYTPENCIWGSDWPFVNLMVKPTYEQALECLDRWVPDEATRRKVLWDTPTRLFGFV